MADTKRTIIFLSAILLALLVVSGGVLYVLPTLTNPSNEEVPTPTPAAGETADIDTSVFNRTDYNQLDASLIQQGALPVRPPAVTGKANPFL